MIALTLKEIAAVCDAQLEGADPDAIVSSVETDSRACAPGSLFVALAGERTDGHLHADAAIAGGAIAAIVGQGFNGAAPVLRVDDPMRALTALATDVRARLTCRVIAITGSAGKTCTKDMTAAALAGERSVVATVGNHNNEIGVPLTVLAADEDTEVLVCEVGSRGRGHLAALMPIVRPDVSVVTNVGGAHVGMFGSLEETAAAKAEVIEALGPDGVAVLNADDDLVSPMALRARGSVVLFGRSARAEVRADDVALDADACASFTLRVGVESLPVHLRLPGEHMVSNALAAVAASRACGVSLEAIARGLEVASVTPGRMQVREVGGVRVIDDTYNASPDSMIAALKALVAMGRGRTTWAVVGPMAELGDETVREHDRIGRMAVRLGVARLVVIGDDAKPTFEAARHEGMPPAELAWFSTWEEAADHVRAAATDDAVILVKASRAAGLERIVAVLVEERA